MLCIILLLCLQEDCCSDNLDNQVVVAAVMVVVGAVMVVVAAVMAVVEAVMVEAVMVVVAAVIAEVMTVNLAKARSVWKCGDMAYKAKPQ